MRVCVHARGCVFVAGWQLACLPMLISFACMSDKVPMNIFVLLPLAKAVSAAGEMRGGGGVLSAAWQPGVIELCGAGRRGEGCIAGARLPSDEICCFRCKSWRV